MEQKSNKKFTLMIIIFIVLILILITMIILKSIKERELKEQVASLTEQIKYQEQAVTIIDTDLAKIESMKAEELRQELISIKTKYVQLNAKLIENEKKLEKYRNNSQDTQERK